MKKSFILHIDSLSILNELNLEQKGILFNAIYQYQLGNEIELDFAMKIAFLPFKNQFIRDDQKYNETIESKIYAGKLGNLKRWHNDLYMKVVENEIDIDCADNIAKSRKESQNIAPAINESQNIADNRLNDNDNDSVNKKESKKYKNKHGKNSNILLTENEYQKLCLEYTKEKTDKAIDYLSDWGLEKPKNFKEYQNHNLTLRRWVFEAIDKNSNKDIKPDIVGGVDVKKWYESSTQLINQDLRTPKEHNQVVRQNNYDSKYLLPE